MKTKLKNLEVTKVDAVDAGANPDAYIKLFKKRDKSGEVTDLGETQVESIAGKIAKAIADIFKPAGVVEKREEAESFGEKMDEVQRRKIVDEMWDLCYALHSSLVSIMNDDEVEPAAAGGMMQQSINEFTEYISGAIGKWSSGNVVGVVQKGIEDVTESDVLHMEYIGSRIDESIQNAKTQLEKSKGELEDMIKIDKSKMSPAEAYAYEEIIKKYGVETDGKSAGAGVEKKKAATDVPEEEIEEEGTEKGKKNDCAKSAPASVHDDPGDVYKGLNPVVKAEIEELRKFREDMVTRELTEVAKKYAIIGKKPEELVPLLKNLKAAGGTAYADMLGILDSAVSIAESSGVFAEIGKSGSHYTGVAKSDAESKVAEIAKKYVEKEPSMTITEAMAKAWEDNPELVAAYENEAGF